MSDTADNLDHAHRKAGTATDTDVVGLIERIAERSGVLTLDAALEAARSVEHGANPAREAAQLKDLARQSLDTFAEVSARARR